MKTEQKIPVLVDQAGVAWAIASLDPNWRDVRKAWQVAVILPDRDGRAAVPGAIDGPIGVWRTVGNQANGTRHAAMEAAEAFAAAVDAELDETMRSEDGDAVPVAVQLDTGLVAVYRVRLEVRREFVAEFQGG